MIKRRSFMISLLGLFAAPTAMEKPLQVPRSGKVLIASADGQLTEGGRRLFGDIIYRAADFPWSDKIAARLQGLERIPLEPKEPYFVEAA